MKKFLIILTMFVTLCVGMASAFAQAPSVVDEARILRLSERQKLEKILQEYEVKYQVRMAVVTKKSIGNAIPGQYANRLIDEVYNDGRNGNMVLLQVVDQSKWYISTDKKLKSVIIGNAGTEYISKAFVPKLRKQPLEAYTIYAQRSGELLAYYQANGKGWTPAASKQSGKRGPDIEVVALIAAVIAGAVTWQRRASLINAMSNVRRAVSANAYVEKDKFELNVSRDNFLFTNTIVTPVSNGRDHNDMGGVSDNCGDGGHGGGGGNY